MDKQTLKAEKRSTLGRKVSSLRREGLLPANIYGKKVRSHAVQVVLKDFEKVFSKTGETGLVELVVGGKKSSVLIHNTQRDPVTDGYLHADFLQVDLKQKVTAQVPVEIVGEAPAEKQGLGTVVQHMDEIQVEALPTNLPEKFEVDLSKLTEVDSTVLVKDVGVGKGKVEVKDDPEQIIVKVEPLRKEEEVVVKPAEGEEEVVEGEEGVEGTEEAKEESVDEEKELDKGSKEEASK